MKVIRTKTIYKELTFSEAIEQTYLYQKEFGIIPSGVKRFGNKAINRVRSGRDNWIKSIENKLDDNMFEKLDIIDKYQEANRIHDFELDKKLLREAKNNKMRVLRTDRGLNPMVISNKQKVKPDLDKIEEVYGRRFRKKMENSLNKGEDVILYPRLSGSEDLAHEIGHKMNESGSLIDRAVSKFNREVSRDNFNKFSDGSPYADKKSGVKELITRGIKGKSVIKEETNANKKGLDLLKKYGVKKEDLERAGKNLEIGTNSYRNDAKSYNKTPLLNILKSTKKIL